MPDDPNRHHRRSLRLSGYDYAQAGAYFVTVCVQGRACVFGKIVDGEMRLSEAAQMVGKVWEDVPQRFLTVHLGDWVVMPNHFHAIVFIGPPPGQAQGPGQAPGLTPQGHADRDVGAPLVGAQGKKSGVALGNVIGSFKSITTNEYARGVQENGWPPFHQHLWQRNYYEHIVRDEQALYRVAEYIRTNAMRWNLDRENPDRRGEDDFDQWLESQGARPTVAP